jgi:hypothetical protein
MDGLFRATVSKNTQQSTLAKGKTVKPFRKGTHLSEKQKRGDTAHRRPPSTNQRKVEVIRAWIHPEERITVNFEDSWNLNAEVVVCTTQTVTLRLEAQRLGIPYYQDVVLPIRQVTVTEDPSKYTRNPGTPVRYGRLKLNVRSKRPAIV